MSDMPIVEQYIRLWNERDVQRRRELADSVFVPDARYTDPLASVHGIAQITALIAEVQGQLNGLPIELLGRVDAHHDVARFHWHVVHPEHGEAIVIGFDVARIEDGRIAEVLGFLDKAPQPASAAG